MHLKQKTSKKITCLSVVKEKNAKQACAMPFSLVYQLYLNYLSFASHSYIFHNTITYKWGNARKDLTTSLFSSKPQYLQGFSQGRCLPNRSLNTSPNTSLILLFPQLNFIWNSYFQKSDENKNLRRKSDLLSEVLSEVFGKHLTLRIPCKQRCFGWKSEVVRSFYKLLIFSQKRKARQTNKIAYLADW